jgi:hypothetical protein
MFTPTTLWDVQYIPIPQILMTSPISKAIQAQGAPKPVGFSADPRPAGFQLSRMTSLLQTMRDGTPLPPISVVKITTSTGDVFYSVEDGRHRFACSIVLGYAFIPAIVQ